MNRAVVGVGSNISPDEHIGKARQLLAHEQSLAAESQFVTTRPIGYADQADFVNGAWLVDTELNRHQFEEYLRDVELRLGRVRTSDKYSPRTIDLDIVAWNGAVVSPDVQQRDFLRSAVLQIAPDLDAQCRKEDPQ